MQPPGGVPKMLSSFLQSLVLLTLTGKLLKKLHPAPLYCLSSEPDYVGIKKTIIFIHFTQAPETAGLPNLLFGCYKWSSSCLTLMQAQRQQGHLSLIYLVKIKQLGNPLLGVYLKGENYRSCTFPLQKILYRLPN